jgi:hypothetical protein
MEEWSFQGSVPTEVSVWHISISCISFKLGSDKRPKLQVVWEETMMTHVLSGCKVVLMTKGRYRGKNDKSSVNWQLC